MASEGMTMRNTDQFLARTARSLVAVLMLMATLSLVHAADPAPARDFSRPAGADVRQPTGSAGVASPAGGVSIRKDMPARVAVGEPYIVHVVVRAGGPASNVVVRDAIPDGVDFEGSDPRATLQDRTLTWSLGDLQAGDTRTISMKLIARREGALGSCATVTTTQEVCVATVAGVPRLALSKVGPEAALIGTDVPYTITVKNVGTATARQVVLTDTVPEGMSHASGQRTIQQPVGDLEPGQEHTVRIAMRADRRGKSCNTVAATAANAAKQEAQACTVIMQQGLKVEKTGTREQFVNKRADYTITVRNTGDTDLTRVTVVDQLPESYRVVDAAGASQNGQTLTWQIDRLPGGAAKQFTITVVGLLNGEHCNRVAASCAERLSDQAQACTIWTGHSALLLELVDTDDPLLPNEVTTFIIRVTNQGTADDRAIRVVGSIPAELEPISGDGDSDIIIEGKTFRMAIIDRIAPKQAVEWRLKCKAIQAGDARLRVDMTSELLKRPVREEESTHIY